MDRLTHGSDLIRSNFLPVFLVVTFVIRKSCELHSNLIKLKSSPPVFARALFPLL